MEEGEAGDDPEGDPEAAPPREQPKPKQEPRKKSGRPGALQVYEDETKVYRIRLPEEWTVSPREGNLAMALDIQLPGSRSRSSISVRVVDRMGDARSMPVNNLDNSKQSFNATDARTRSSPVPHIELRYPRGGEDWMAIISYRKIRGNGLVFQLECSDAVFERLRDPFLAAAQSFEADLELYPPIPKTYKIKKKGIVTYAQHPRVKSIKDTLKLFSSVEKRFTRYHGKFPKSDDEQPVVYILRQMRDARSVLEAVADSTNDQFMDWANVRLFATPVIRSDLNKLGILTENAHQMYFRLVYGTQEPHWARTADGGWARSHETTGKKLPFMQDGLANWRQQTTIGRLDKLDSLRGQGDGSAFYKQSFFYGCFFHAGPSKYRKAYKQFLKAWRETGNGKRAAEKHLYSIGIEKIQQAATKWVHQDLKPLRVKPK
ncbi:MAG: hypothetical protein O7C98_09355 [Planctomycetota bacterium]|nr:hypothetical protein [Planctomycetota bacterium]